MSQPSREPDDRPVAPVFVLANGTRVAVDLRYTGFREDVNSHVWQPIIEGDIAKLMPVIHGFDAEYWPVTSALLFPTLETAALSRAWAERVCKNSPKLKRVRAAGQWTTR